MSFCPLFKNGYFGICTASGSNHVPSIAEMEQYCFSENFLCPIFELYTTKKYQGSSPGMKYAHITGLNANPSEK